MGHVTERIDAKIVVLGNSSSGVTLQEVLQRIPGSITIGVVGAAPDQGNPVIVATDGGNIE